MCSLEDDNVENISSQNHLEPKTFLKPLQAQCNKCKAFSPRVVLRNNNAYCKECFLAGIVHKFKAFLGKHHLVNPSNNVLVCLKGGHPSIALMHLLRSGLNLSTPRRLRFKPIIIHILDIDYKQEVLKIISNTVNSFNFTLYFISLEEYISNAQNLDALLYTDISKIRFTNSKNFEQLLNLRCKSTAKQTLKDGIERRLLIDVAKHLQCSCVFTPDIAINIASDLLTNISLGRGSHLALDVGISDKRDKIITIVKPLRFFEMKELAYYNIFNKIEPIILYSLTENRNENVQELLKTFVDNLQINFPATITTILRIGDKLAINKDILKNEACAFCKVPKDSIQADLNSAEATNFSSWISTEYKNSDLMDYSSFPNIQNKGNNQYCYACNKIYGYVEKFVFK